MKTIFRNPESFRVWHDRLGHLGFGMMRRIINNSVGHNVETNDFPNPEDFICPACAKGKLITRPSLLKIRDESPVFLEMKNRVTYVDLSSPCRARLGISWY